MRSILILLPLTLAAQPSAQPPKPGAVDGTVVNAVTGAAVKDCTVTLQSKTRTHDRFRYIAVTDDQGRFVFPTVEPDPDYSAEAQCAGFTNLPETRATRKDSQPIAVAEALSVHDVKVNLLPLAVISGKVVDADGEPLRGVSVQASQYKFLPGGRVLDSVADAKTDARGRYRLYFLQPGRYIVSAFLRVTPPGPAGLPGHVHNSIPAEGFLPAWYPGPPDAAQATAFNVMPASDLADLDFRLAATPVFDIRGTLVTDLPKPPPVTVVPCTTLDLTLGFPADSLPHNIFDARSLPPGQYCLVASQSSWRRVTADAVVVVANRDVEGVTLTAPPLTPLQGLVVVEDPAKTLPALHLTLQNPGVSACCDAYEAIKSDGSFLTRPVAPGSYLFSLVGLTKGLYVKSLRLGDRVIPGNRIDVLPGAGRLSIVLGVDPGEVTGKVEDSEGNPGDRIVVTLAPKGNIAGRIDLMRRANTQADGSFQITQVAPGEYNILAWESDENDLQSPDYINLFTGKATTVSVDSSGKASVQLKSITAKEMEDARWRSQ